MKGKAAFLVLSDALVEEASCGTASTAPRLVRPALRAIPMLRDAGFNIVVVAQEPGIALGESSEDALLAAVRRLEEAITQLDSTMAGFYYCPHHPSGTVPAHAVDCVCRRPQPGLIIRAASELGVELSASWVIGDLLDDIEAGHRAGCRTIMVDTGSETDWRINRDRIPHFLTGDLAKAARIIIAADRKPLRDLGDRRAS